MYGLVWSFPPPPEDCQRCIVFGPTWKAKHAISHISHRGHPPDVVLLEIRTPPFRPSLDLSRVIDTHRVFWHKHHYLPPSTDVTHPSGHHDAADGSLSGVVLVYVNVRERTCYSKAGGGAGAGRFCIAQRAVSARTGPRRLHPEGPPPKGSHDSSDCCSCRPASSLVWRARHWQSPAVLLGACRHRGGLQAVGWHHVSSQDSLPPNPPNGILPCQDAGPTPKGSPTVLS